MALSLRNMLLAVVATLVALLGIQGWLSITKLTDINQNVAAIADNWLPSVKLTNAMNTNTSDMRIAEGAHIMSTSAQDMSAAEADFEAALKSFQANQSNYEPLISSDEERQTYERFKSGFTHYMALHKRLLELSRANQNTEAAALFRGELKSSFDAYSVDLLKLVQINEAGAKSAKADSDAQFNGARTTTFIAIAIALVIAGGATWVVVSLVIKPINSVTRTMQTISQGRLDTEIPFSATRNEVGDMARTLAVFRDGLREAETLRAEAAEREKAAAAERKRVMLDLADDFEKSVGGIVSLVSSAATEMQAAASQLSATAQEASAQSVAVSAAAEEAGANVTSVASSTEELGASVSEIGRQVETSASIASGAVKEAEEAQLLVGELDETAASIGGVVELIAGLASQTNLLALNATIESARAGEAGKGFAVVAAEVKALAAQTAKATTDISEKITKIQDATSRAATAMRNIGGTIQSLNHSSTAIASAVEQQSAATREIIQAVNQASIGTQEVTSNITGVAQAAEQTGEAAVQVQSSSCELATQAERLHHEMDKFLQTVRSA